MNDDKIQQLEAEWQQKIKLLTASRVWDPRIDNTVVERWLENFTAEVGGADQERLHAYHLLQQFMYFGNAEIKEMLRALYRDHFVYPTVQRLKKKLKTTDISTLHSAYESELEATRFLGVGTPAESGTHLLYYFRQENQLSKDSFTTLERLFRFPRNGPPQIREPGVRNFIYIDDFCGSGQQVTSYLSDVVDGIKSQLPDARIAYLMLFATSVGLNNVKSAGIFDEVSAVVELDEHYRLFSDRSLYFKDASEVGVDINFSRQMMETYGRKLFEAPLGYGDCQLLVGFHHNTPDNTLPVFWAENDSPQWTPIFRRYHKIY